MLAHIGGLPAEEALPAPASSAGAWLLLARARLVARAVGWRRRPPAR